MLGCARQKLEVQMIITSVKTIVVDLSIWGLFRGNSYVLGKWTSGESTMKMHATWWTVLDSHSDKRSKLVDMDTFDAYTERPYFFLSAIRAARP